MKLLATPSFGFIVTCAVVGVKVQRSVMEFNKKEVVNELRKYHIQKQQYHNVSGTSIKINICTKRGINDLFIPIEVHPHFLGVLWVSWQMKCKAPSTTAERASR